MRTLLCLALLVAFVAADKHMHFGLMYKGKCDAQGCELRGNSQKIKSLVSPKDGIKSSVDMAIGAYSALHLSDKHIKAGGKLHQSGVMDFGIHQHRSHQIMFNTVGDGHYMDDHSIYRGAASYNVTGGSGEFSGARGTITISFVDHSGETHAYAFASLNKH